jgi:hypothetical protein
MRCIYMYERQSTGFEMHVWVSSLYIVYVDVICLCNMCSCI